jgi:hypothetical protein
MTAGTFLLQRVRRLTGARGTRNYQPPEMHGDGDGYDLFNADNSLVTFNGLAADVFAFGLMVLALTTGRSYLIRPYLILSILSYDGARPHDGQVLLGGDDARSRPTCDLGEVYLWRRALTTGRFSWEETTRDNTRFRVFHEHCDASIAKCTAGTFT